jgi:hypothetical protein
MLHKQVNALDNEKTAQIDVIRITSVGFIIFDQSQESYYFQKNKTEHIEFPFAPFG